MNLSILDQMWLELTPTASYSRRWLLWVPGVSLVNRDSGYAASVHQQHGERSGNKITRGEYQVEFTGPVLGAMAYGFVFLKLNPGKVKNPNERESPYEVQVGPNLFSCNCTAASCRVPVCLHRSVVCAAIFAGLVDGAKPWPGMPESEPEQESGSWFDPDLGELEHEYLFASSGAA